MEIMKKIIKGVKDYHEFKRLYDRFYQGKTYYKKHPEKVGDIDWEKYRREIEEPINRLWLKMSAEEKLTFLRYHRHDEDLQDYRFDKFED